MVQQDAIASPVDEVKSLGHIGPISAWDCGFSITDSRDGQIYKWQAGDLPRWMAHTI
jgi:hypothetical protein